MIDDFPDEAFLFMPVAIPYILLVESDEAIAAMLQEVIKEELKMKVMFAQRASDVIKVTKAIKPLLFLINERLIDGDGLKLYEYLHSKQGLQNIPAIILSTNERVCQQYTERQDPTYLSIPTDIDTIVSMLNAALVSFQKQIT